MRKILQPFLLSISISAFGQNLQKEIEDQIWTPFTKAWESNNSQAYNDLHTDDVWRITPQGLVVGDEYKNRNEERMSNNKNQSRKIEFWFEHRLANGNNAYQVGYYRITDTSTTETQYYYGRFHVGLKKIDGQWKISQDWDTSNINGGEVTAEEYAKGESKHYE